MVGGSTSEPLYFAVEPSRSLARVTPSCYFAVSSFRGASVLRREPAIEMVATLRQRKSRMDLLSARQGVAGRPGGLSSYILEHGIGQFREFESPRQVHARRYIRKDFLLCANSLAKSARA